MNTPTKPTGRVPIRRIAVAALFLAMTGAGSAPASSQAIPAQPDTRLVEVRTWSTPAPDNDAMRADLDGTLLDTTDAETLLAASVLGAAGMAARAASRKEG